MSKLLVTGGEGFIGGRIAQLTGAISYDLKSQQDILDQEKLSSVCEGVSGIFHCAARISVPESFEKFDEYHRTNVEGTRSVMQVAESQGAKIVFSSSASVYGESDRPAQEVDALLPLSPYAENKRDGESLLQSGSQSSVILRYFNVYGPGQSPAYAGVITAFIQAAMQGDDIIIYGDGNQVRDFVYVDDVAMANIAALNSEFRNGEIFNIASGTRVSINELAEQIIQLANSSSKIVYAPGRTGDIFYSQADVTKAKGQLGWEARTGLEEGLRKTIESFRG
jgi:UDP-glucose 4-epimerase